MGRAKLGVGYGSLGGEGKRRQARTDVGIALVAVVECWKTGGGLLKLSCTSRSKEPPIALAFEDFSIQYSIIQYVTNNLQAAPISVYDAIPSIPKMLVHILPCSYM